MTLKETPDIVLDCFHRWRQLLVQSSDFPHNVSFLCWECAIEGCATKAQQAKLDPVGLGGEMTSEIRILGPGGGPVILHERGLAKEIIRGKDGKMETKYFTGLE